MSEHSETKNSVVGAVIMLLIIAAATPPDLAIRLMFPSFPARLPGGLSVDPDAAMFARRTAICILLGALAAACSPPPPREVEVDAPLALQAIETLRTTLASTYTLANAGALAGLYTPDAVTMRAGQPSVTGRQAILDVAPRLAAVVTPEDAEVELHEEAAARRLLVGPTFLHVDLEIVRVGPGTSFKAQGVVFEAGEGG